MAARASSIGQPIAAEAYFDLINGAPERIIAFDGPQAISAKEFLRHVHGVAAQIAGAGRLLNLCEGRYRFLVTWCAGLVCGIPTLLPPSRAPAVIVEMLERYPDALPIGDDLFDDGIALERVPPGYVSLPNPLPSAPGDSPKLPASLLTAIGFTSGSSGPPTAQRKHWGSFCGSTARNADVLFKHAGAACHLLATVPSQHMYGMEMSVLLPLLGGATIHTARPFFPADISAALADLPEPRVLVTTPVHLRALIDSGLSIPKLAMILCATAPLSQALAQAAEAATGANVLEFFGSTETCIIGHRRTAHEDAWTRHSGVVLESQPGGTLVDAPWLAAPVLLHDLIEHVAGGGFRLAGRASDHLEIAGKRVSLGELTRRLLAIEGVSDGVVFQLDTDGQVQRIAALVVAPSLREDQLLVTLRESIDPVFLPRPLRIVERLPRNETGKLPRFALLNALRQTSGEDQ